MLKIENIKESRQKLLAISILELIAESSLCWGRGLKTHKHPKDKASSGDIGKPSHDDVEIKISIEEYI